MKTSVPFLVALASLLGQVSVATPLEERGGSSSVNPFLGKQYYISPVYTAEVNAAVKTILKKGDKVLAKKAAKVADVPTFIWISSTSAVPSIGDYLKEATKIQKKTGKKQIVPLVVYNLPDRDCSAKASDGELHLDNNGEELYKQFIQSIGKILKKYPDVTVVIQLETDAVGNIVTNQSVEKCGKAAPAHLRSLAYAVAQFSEFSNVSVYLDGAHAGWLGWPGNIGPTADTLAGILGNATAINPKSRVRGVATNVSNYNGLGNQNQTGYDELVYHQNLAPLLTARGFPAHFIVDQGRSGNQAAARTGGDWCNFKNAGFGPRPTTNTPNKTLIDAIVWVKPGGEGDGTTNTSSPRYDTSCSSETSLQPAPEAGTWFQEYFELLVKQANPAF